MNHVTRKVAVVTGGSRGIGRAISIEFGRVGFDVVVNYVSNSAAANEVVKEIETMGSNAIAVQANIGNYEQGQTLIEKVIEHYGRIDVLVNNAGVWRGGRINLVTKADWDYVIDTNVKGLFHCTQSVVPQMIKQGGGSIINITSIIGLIGFAGDSIYGSSKAAIIGFTKSLAKEVARHGISVNAVAPGIIATDMNANLQEKTREQLASRIPMGRLGEAEEIAKVVRFLAIEGTYITGQVITADGGYVLGK